MDVSLVIGLVYRNSWVAVFVVVPPLFVLTCAKHDEDNINKLQNKFNLLTIIKIVNLQTLLFHLKNTILIIFFY